MWLQKSNLCTAIFLWRRLARSLTALRFAPRWNFRCFMLNALCTRPLSISPYLLFSPAVFIFSFLFAPLHCSADPSFWGALFPTAAGVEPRQQQMLRCWSSSDPPVRLCRGESHSGASPTLSPLLPGRLHARLLSVFFCTHSHPLPALVPFSLLLLRIRLFATIYHIYQFTIT